MKIKTAFRLPGPIFRATLKDQCEILDAVGGLSGLATSELADIQVLVTSGVIGASRDEMRKLPALRLICAAGTGYENVDIEAARERNIMVTHGAGSNAPAVAEYAMGLLLALVRDITGYNEAVKKGEWRGKITPRPLLSAKKIGIAGLGAVGTGVARRAEAFDMKVFYFSRSPKDTPGWTRVDTLLDLAREVDFLIAVLPGGAPTFHAVNADVLNALGPKGYLVNIGRGTVVDTSALVEALTSGAIAGAALDVYETEPDVPPALRAAPNVILSPHVGGTVPEVQQIAANLMLRNIKGYFAGTGVLSAIPELR